MSTDRHAHSQNEAQGQSLPFHFYIHFLYFLLNRGYIFIGSSNRRKINCWYGDRDASRRSRIYSEYKSKLQYYMLVIYYFQSTDNIFILFRISFIDLFSFRFTCTCIVQNIAKLNDNVLNFVIMIFETKLDKTRYMYTKLLNNGNNGFSKLKKKWRKHDLK